MKYLFFLLIFLLFSSCKSDLDLLIKTPPTGSLLDIRLTYDEKIDISYGKEEIQKYDLYLPSTRNTRNPVIVLLHPGAWRIGDKGMLNPIIQRFLDKRVNCAIVNTNYRLTSTVGITYKNQLDDINELLKKIKKDAPELGIASNNFFLVGLSAGGHLAMLYANSPDQDRFANGVGGIVPPVNLATPEMRNGVLSNDILKVVGKTFTENPEEYYKVSPVYQFTPASPPTIVFFGGKDTVVPPEQANFCNQMMVLSRMKKSEFVFDPNRPHESNKWDDVIDKLVSFAEINL